MEIEENIDDEILLRASYVFGFLQPPVKCHYVDQIDAAYFVRMYEYMSGEEIPGSKGMKTDQAKQIICQFMIDTVADDILQFPLDHITGKGVVDKDRRVLKDLLDIFIQVIEASDLEPGNGVEQNSDDSRIVPNKIRKALTDIEFDANQMLHGTISYLQHKPKSTETRQTQTTPKNLTSSVTSPVTWGKVLAEHSTTPRPKHRRPSTGSLRKPLSSVTNTKAANSHAKSKPVISTKCKKTSPVSLKGKSRIVDKENMRRSNALQEDLNKVKERRKEIAALINRLQSEDSRLKSLESIMEKDLKFSRSTGVAKRIKKDNPLKPDQSTSRRRPVMMR